MVGILKPIPPFLADTWKKILVNQSLPTIIYCSHKWIGTLHFRVEGNTIDNADDATTCFTVCMISLFGHFRFYTPNRANIMYVSCPDSVSRACPNCFEHTLLLVLG